MITYFFAIFIAMSYLDQHYQILGIPSGSSVEVIKKAYRKKSMELHPDVNKHPNATAQFVQLNESYEYLVHALTNKIFLPASGTFVHRKKEGAPMTYQEWQARCREEVHNRAYKQAQEHLNQFKKSAYYRNSYQFGRILFYIVVAMIYLFTIGVPVIVMTHHFTIGVVLFLVLNIGCGGLHRMVYDTFKELSRERKYIRKVQEAEERSKQ